MNHSIKLLRYQNKIANHEKQLSFNGHFLEDLAKRFGTPLYLYSLAEIENTFKAYQKALSDMKFTKAHLHFAVKSNDRLAILKIYQKLGSSFDIVSGGELLRLVQIGVLGQDIVFSGVGKTKDEIKLALTHQVSCINVESQDELDTIIEVCQQENQVANIVLRVNPDIDAKTHPYISTGLKSNKFGLDFKTAFAIFQNYQKQSRVNFVGVSSHIGSQITDLSVFKQSALKIAKLVKKIEANGIKLKTINLGGGIGIDYQNETLISISDYAKMIDDVFKGMNQRIILEPGRSLIGRAGILLTQVLYLKDNQDYHFCIVDASMTELIRPSLYQAYHPILPVVQKETLKAKNWQIVGPVCESGDTLGADRWLAVEKNDYLAITHTGAYCAVMMSHYNSRIKPSEVLLTDNEAKLIVKPTKLTDLWSDEIFK